MRVTVLGGAAAGGNPGSGCSGYLVQAAGTNLVIDLGPGTLPELRNHCDFRDIDAIIITHWHVDHYLDLAAFRFAAAYNPRPLERQISLYMPPGTVQLLRRFGSALPLDETDYGFFDKCFAIEEYDPELALSIAGLTCRFHPTRHFVPCWAVRISDESHTDVGYTADTGPAAGLERFFRGVHTLIAESTELDRDPDTVEPGHLTANEAAMLASACGAKTLVLTHMWVEYAFNNYLQRARQSFDGEILLASPGLKLSPGETMP